MAPSLAIFSFLGGILVWIGLVCRPSHNLSSLRILAHFYLYTLYFTRVIHLFLLVHFINIMFVFWKFGYTKKSGCVECFIQQLSQSFTFNGILFYSHCLFSATGKGFKSPTTRYLSVYLFLGTVEAASTTGRSARYQVMIRPSIATCVKNCSLVGCD